MIADTIPEAIAARIEQAAEELRLRNEQEERKRAEAEACRQAEIAEAWQVLDGAIAEQFDPLFAPYLVPGRRDDNPGRFTYQTLQVPGLAPIRVSFDTFKVSRYSVASLTIEHDYDDGKMNKVGWDWRYSTDCEGLDQALLLAKERQADYDIQAAELERINQERAKRAQEREHAKAEWGLLEEKAEQEREARRETESVRQLREEQLLLDALKDDPAAVALLKLFANIQAEREHYQAQIDALNESAEWDALRHAEHTAKLRKEADHFTAEAREADLRARDASSELDDVKRKAKKAGVKV